jgi:hypothetical protein
MTPPGAGRQQDIAAVPRQQAMIVVPLAVPAGRERAARSATTAAKAVERRIRARR